MNPTDEEAPNDSFSDEAGEVPADLSNEPLVTVATYTLLKDALPARLTLESEGIDCVLLDQMIAGLDPIMTLAGGGMRLQVRPADAARAAEVLGLAAPPAAWPPLCPHCGADKTARVEEARRLAYFLLALIAFVFPAYRARWRCGACGHEWKQG